jgi:GAF domain-containing protein
MTATLNDEVAELRRANAELQQRLDEAIGERNEALDQQTATAEILRVINSSPGSLASVFDAILEKATHLCEASLGILRRYDGEVFRAIAVLGVSGQALEMFYQPVVPDPGSASERLVLGERVVHIPDLIDTEAYRSGVASRRWLVKVTGGRTALWVALRKDDALLGDFVIYRKEVRPFTDKHIALLENFAAQAVIAMENARLLTETREALEQQTATAEVLQVINSSPGDLNPVFDAMLEKAMRLCGAAFGFMTVIDREQSRTVAARGVPAAYAAFRERNPTPANAPISPESVKASRSSIQSI